MLTPTFFLARLKSGLAVGLTPLLIVLAGTAANTAANTVSAQTGSAIFAGGCFWCIEKDFEQLPGVIEVTSGYSGGHTKNPTYRQVSANKTGHYEVVKIDYDPAKVSYSQLLDAYWHSIDPTDPGGQFCDRGHPYKTAVFAGDPAAFALAQESKDALIRQGTDIVTPILTASVFYPAEDYHQDYYKKNPVRYAYYRRSCGRNKRVKQVWGEDAYRGLPGDH